MKLRRLVHACFLVLTLAGTAHAGMNADSAYTERGKIDFDTALQLLNPYGTWSKINDKWAYTPLDHQAPYTHGRWLYTEFGWYWKGSAPHSWATEHYGYWKRGADKVWSWYPGDFWLPQIVEIRATSKYIGWHLAEVDEQGNFVEPPIDRFSRPEDWTFVTLAQFANPITPSEIAPPDVAKEQLEDSTDCRHTYLTYREIDRPGPHPADFVGLSKDGNMLAPLTARDLAPAPVPASALPATNYAAHMTGTNAPALIGTEIDPTADTRKVKYWITMSLPTFWSKPPEDAKPDQIYLYRPDFYQDNDGIARRTTLWFNPNARTKLADVLGASTLGKAAQAGATDAAGAPAVPASPARDPFRSPLDETPHSGTTNRATSTSSKAPVPSGLAAPDGLAPTSGK
jgi:hypothetical protein